ncbi:DUF6851 domain-containing protein [Chamaesiphon sp.]|uniref:vanadium-dependent haloperoxidase n=1 Tax=Chamaesiphon sp. TaxID=2814140 RepID=UPI0035935221
MDTVSVIWANAALEAIRNLGKPDKLSERARIGPPMVARSLAILHTAIFDAWAVYDSNAIGTRLRLPRQLVTAEEVKKQAMSQAAYRVLKDQFPTEVTVFDTAMSLLGFSPSISEDPAMPEGIGNLAAKAILDYRHWDGANQCGELSVTGKAYADYTNYIPSNLPVLATEASPVANTPHPDLWQPLSYLDPSGKLQIPTFIAPHWEKVTPFALTSASQFRPSSPQPITSQAFLDQAKYVTKVQKHLTTKQKVIAEYWADGPKTELPPGHWELFAMFVSQRDSHSLDADAKMFFALANAIHDAAIATWEAKRYYDYTRPITAIRHLLRGKTIEGWDGNSITSIQGEEWRPYQVSTFPTPPFPEFTSGHSAFSMAGAEALKRFTGSDRFGASYEQPEPLRVEPGLAEAVGTVLQWETFTAAAQEAGESRLYGGIHFYEGNVAGLALGRKVGAQAFDRAREHWEGTL